MFEKYNHSESYQIFTTINMFQLIKYKNKLAEAKYSSFLNAALESTICFFYNDEKGIQRQAGCGVFIKQNVTYYVVTAAHVLAEKNDSTYINLKDKILMLGGNIFSSILPISGNRDDDKIDLSVIRLDIESAQNLLTMYKPIDFAQVGFNHNLRSTDSYFLIGYPYTRTKYKRNSNIIKSQSFKLRTIPILDYNFSKFGFSHSTTIAVKFDEDITSASIPNPHLAPDLKGMSGSGLWYIEEEKKYLIGIVIQNIKERGYKAILATKIDVALGAEIQYKTQC